MIKAILATLLISATLAYSVSINTAYMLWRSAGNQKTPPTEEGLVSYWDMEETGGYVLDSFGTNDMQVINSATFGSSYGVRGNGIDFDGINQYLTAPSFTVGVFTNQMTISEWINVDNVLDHSPLLARWNDGGGKRTFFLTQRRVDLGGIVFSASGDGANGQGYTANTNGLSTNTWVHIAATFNAGVVSLYYDGVFKGAATNSTQLSFYQAGSDPVVIGGGANIAGARYYDGSIDEVRMYNRALTPEEILVLYNYDKP